MARWALGPWHTTLAYYLAPFIGAFRVMHWFILCSWFTAIILHWGLMHITFISLRKFISKEISYSTLIQEMNRRSIMSSDFLNQCCCLYVTPLNSTCLTPLMSQETCPFRYYIASRSLLVMLSHSSLPLLQFTEQLVLFF